MPGLLQQDPTYIGGSQNGQNQLLGGYSKQQGVYDLGRQQGLGYVSRAANGVDDANTLGMGTTGLERYRQAQVDQYQRAPNDLMKLAQERGPSLAQAQMQQGLGRVQAGNLAQAGASNNSALGVRNAMMANARAGADVAVNAGVARAAEEAAYQQRVLQAAQAQNQAAVQARMGVDQNILHQQQLQTQGMLGLGGLGVQQQGLYTGAFQGQQQLGQQVQLTQAQMDAQREAANQAAMAGFVGSAVGGTAQAAGSMYTGGALGGVR